ncbi:MAG: hypothetical protein H7X88_05250, partial [Gloeobacteraceae cyanobacterium ES-bin-316]|nr:hypothetical protein [Ferruginibacter sp.]
MIKEIKLLPQYPSGSALAFLKDKLYVMGDDATSLLVLDKSFAVLESIEMLESTEKRIAKISKPDIEAMAVVSRNKEQALLLLGSGSTDS